MAKTRFAFCLALLIGIFINTRAQNASSNFTEIKGLPDEFESTHFEFSVGSYQFKISNYGKGIVQTGNAKSRGFNLQFSRGDYLYSSLFHAEYKGDLLLMGDIGDVEYGHGFIARLDMRMLKLKWKNSLAGFNVGNGLIHEGYAYVTAIGFIGKINIESGKYVWKHRGLYRRKSTAFNSFDVPELKGKLVVFKEAPDSRRTKVARIIVDLTTGKILKIDL